MDVDKRLKVLYYEMPYIEREATATRCHTSLGIFVGTKGAANFLQKLIRMALFFRKAEISYFYPIANGLWGGRPSDKGKPFDPLASAKVLA